MRPARVVARERVVSTTSKQRFAARTRGRRLRIAVRVLIGLLVVGASVAAVWVVGWSSFLALRDIRIEGVSGGLAADVRAAAAAPVGRPLIRIDTGAIVGRVADIDEVAAVEVSRSWPHDLVVRVEPRQPAALLRVNEGWKYVDETGAVFGQVSGPPKNLVILDTSSSTAQAPVRAAAVEVANALPADLRDQVEKISARRVTDIHLRLREGAEVVWGGTDRAARKAEVLTALLAQQAKVYDVSAPDRPAIRP